MYQYKDLHKNMKIKNKTSRAKCMLKHFIFIVVLSPFSTNAHGMLDLLKCCLGMEMEVVTPSMTTQLRKVKTIQRLRIIYEKDKKLLSECTDDFLADHVRRIIKRYEKKAKKIQDIPIPWDLNEKVDKKIFKATDFFRLLQAEAKETFMLDDRDKLNNIKAEIQEKIKYFQ